MAVAGAVLTMATAALGTTAFAASADSNTSVQQAHQQAHLTQLISKIIQRLIAQTVTR